MAPLALQRVLGLQCSNLHQKLGFHQLGFWEPLIDARKWF